MKFYYITGVVQWNRLYKLLWVIPSGLGKPEECVFGRYLVKQGEQQCYSRLYQDLAWVELIFFTAAPIVLLSTGDQNSADFWAVRAGGQGLPHFPLPLQQIGWGGGTVGTADPSWPKGYFVAYNIILCNKTEERGFFFCSCYCSGAGHEWLLLHH